MSISDSEFLNQFEALTLDPKYFSHNGHLRLAWLYLNSSDLNEAIDKVTTGISNYANSLGATDKFQHTLTEAIVRIMAMRIEKHPTNSFASFLQANPDLVKDIWGVVGTYYSSETLNSEQAKKQFVEPDLKPFL